MNMCLRSLFQKVEAGYWGGKLRLSGLTVQWKTKWDTEETWRRSDGARGAVLETTAFTEAGGTTPLGPTSSSIGKPIFQKSHFKKFTW